MVLWLPTWAGHSSLDNYADAFTTLAGTMTVVVKPHNNTERFEADRLAALTAAEASSIIAVPASTDLRALIAAADVVVSDVRSGGLTEAILGDRPTVALTDTAATPDTLHPEGRDAVDVCTNPDELASVVGAALEHDRGRERAELSLDLFGPADGDDDGRAAEAILACRRGIGHPIDRRLRAPMWRLAYRSARRVGR